MKQPKSKFIDTRADKLVKLMDKIAKIEKMKRELQEEETQLRNEILGEMNQLEVSPYVFDTYNLIAVELPVLEVVKEDKVIEFCTTNFKEAVKEIKTVLDRKVLLRAVESGMKIPGLKVEKEEHLRVSKIK